MLVLDKQPPHWSANNLTHKTLMMSSDSEILQMHYVFRLDLFLQAKLYPARIRKMSLSFSHIPKTTSMFSLSEVIVAKEILI